MKFLSTLFLSAWMGMAFSLSAADALQVSAEPVSGNITFWKGYRRFFHSIYGSPNNLIIGFNVPALETKYELKNPTFSMSVPPGVKLEEVLAHYISPRSGQAVIYPLPMNTERQADGSLVCTFSEMKDFLEMNRQYSGSMRCKELTFYFEPENFDPSREYTLIYRCTNGNELASENHVILKFLPPIAETKSSEKLSFPEYGEQALASECQRSRPSTEDYEEIRSIRNGFQRLS